MITKFGKLGNKGVGKASVGPPPTPTYKQDFSKWENLGGATITAHAIGGTKVVGDSQEIARVQIADYKNVPWVLKNTGTTQLILMTRIGDSSMLNQHLINVGANPIDLSSDISAGATQIVLMTNETSTEITYSVEETPTFS